LYWAGQPTFQSHSKNILYQQRDSDFPNTHIKCLSWIMGDGPMEYIYWLLMNFPSNFLTSCTCIEQVNLPSSHIGKIYYINRGIVTFLAHILRDSSWIMVDGQMEYIYWLLMNSPDNLLTSCTCIEQVDLPSSHIGKNILYQQRDSDIPNTYIISFSWIMGDGWIDGIHLLTSYELSW
jgi:hypothetical protein